MYIDKNRQSRLLYRNKLSYYIVIDYCDRLSYYIVIDYYVVIICIHLQNLLFLAPMTTEVEEQIPLEQIEEISNTIKTNVSELETLEIYREQADRIHVAYNTEKSENIPSLVKFLEKIDGDIEEGISKGINSQDFVYQNMKYAFNRISAITEDYISIILISKEATESGKKGLILIIDASGVIFIATCKIEALRKFNNDLMSILYPDSQ